MQTVIFPDILFEQNKGSILNRDLFFTHYKAFSESLKNKVIFKKNIINLVISGKKAIDNIDKSFYINDSQGMIIKNGNCLTSEKFAANGQFSSLTLFFDSKYLQEFLLKYKNITSKYNNELISTNSDVYTFDKDSFIEGYINSVLHLINSSKAISTEFTLIKFEELMLYLVQKNGSSLFHFLNGLLANEPNLDFKATVESESLNKYSLEEIAFLCNMSLSTFKRHFSKSFGESPQKWFLKKRMQYAYDLIKRNEKTPSELYLELGYNSLSSFSVAFSKTFGVPPTKIVEV